MRKWIAVAAMAAASTLATVGTVRAEEQSFTIVNIEYEGSKLWLPSTLVVHKGDKVKLKLINNVKADPNQHGYKIAAVNVEEVVTRGEPKTVEFTADKEGIFPITCQLHPAHVGGQLVVLP
ncbi:MAG: cupredoxin domain-containing protein [Deltaproteobacteria bacterium]|nr:cupredoxin domain-containing protein [Deltaproteobacteria bacterium]MBI3389094.1 cupredoxin domain-containing protein [Deltaproteobacteria bacterium]